jgi:hypothetical protein
MIYITIMSYQGAEAQHVCTTSSRKSYMSHPKCLLTGYLNNTGDSDSLHSASYQSAPACAFSKYFFFDLCSTIDLGYSMYTWMQGNCFCGFSWQVFATYMR